jgi:prepilin signal peptidase PulO-like enzyme (type II secretory pathway)
MIWYFVYAAGLIALLTHYRGPNAVWGTATLGALFGLIAAAVSARLNWWVSVQGGAVGALVGVVFEWLPRLANRRNR